jgi:hypothetical protein
MRHDGQRWKGGRKLSDLTVDELKAVIHEVIAEDMEAWRETSEIMADRKLMKQIREADADWEAAKKENYVSWAAEGCMRSFCTAMQSLKAAHEAHSRRLIKVASSSIVPRRNAKIQDLLMGDPRNAQTETACRRARRSRSLSRS